MTEPELHLTEIGQIAISVRDVEQAALFYGEKLGMTLLFKAPARLIKS